MDGLAIGVTSGVSAKVYWLIAWCLHSVRPNIGCATRALRLGPTWRHSPFKGRGERTRCCRQRVGPSDGGGRSLDSDLITLRA